jgi:hypothetical protein
VVYLKPCDKNTSKFFGLNTKSGPTPAVARAQLIHRKILVNEAAVTAGGDNEAEDMEEYEDAVNDDENEEEEEKNKIKKAPIGDEIEKQKGFDTELAKRNGFFVLWILYLRIGGFWAVMVVVTQIALTVVLFFLSMGKDISKGLFDMIYYVPGLIHSLIFG